ncbi:MAG TPA: MliC family protein [Woeseiaceae bacterium]|nr:MliC family protein [Woeseiaceae bacterium]
MKKLIAIALASTLFGVGCTREDPAAVEEEPAVSSAAQMEPAPESPTQAIMQSYSCESGQVVKANYSSFDTATVQYQDRTHEMHVAVSASGARYVGDGMEWWTKGSGPGSEGTLFHHQADGTSGSIIESCVAD